MKHSSFTIRTYPPELQDNAKIINQSSNFFQECDLKHKLQSVSIKDFLWFGSNGSLLKGLDLVLEYFIDRPRYDLHVVGTIDDEFMNYYQKRIARCLNITFHGYLMPELSVEAISEAVEWATTLPREIFHKLIKENISYSKRTWNLERFGNEYRSLLQEAIKTKI